VEKLLGAGAIDMHTTYFETVTAMALQVFAEERVEIVVLEVGLGGRLDATNVVAPSLAVITPVDFDHEAFLGRSLESIAGEKAGILKPDVPAVFARQRPEAARVLEDRAAALGVPVARTEDWSIHDLELDPRGSRFLLAAPDRLPHPDHQPLRTVEGRAAPPARQNLRIHCPLAGEHQVENAVTAAVALTHLGVPGAAIEAGIARTRWPGRLERVSECPEIILDGAHNPAGARALAAYIQRFYSHRRVRLIYGAMRDKAIEEISGVLFPQAQQVIVTAPRQARALSPEAIGQISDHPNLLTAPDIRAALALVRDAAREDVIFVTGSLFLVAEARALLVA
jgi:dihydrofolate synthase/folylpolyglutamate synthase